MNTDTYIIEYGIYFIDSSYEPHTTKVKNCMSELHAKCKLEEYLKKKYNTFSKLVIYKCNRDVMGLFGDMFGMNKSNPFGF